MEPPFIDLDTDEWGSGLEGLNMPTPKTLLVIILRLVIGGLLMVAGVSKSIDPIPFVTFLTALEVSDPVIQHIVLFCVVFFETMIGLLCLTGLALKLSFRISSALFLIFTLVTGYALSKLQGSSCGCFGGLSGTLDYWSVVKNFFLSVSSYYLAQPSLHVLTLDSVVKASQKRMFTQEQHLQKILSESK